MVVSVFRVSLDPGGLRFLTQIVKLIFSFKMDSFKAELKKVALDDNIGAEINLQLSKTKVPSAVLRNNSNTDFDTIKTHFKIMCRTRVAAIILQYPSLKKLTTYMCQILYLAAYSKYKKRMMFEPNMQRVLETVGTIVESWVAFLERVGLGLDEVEHLKEFKTVIDKAKEGDEEVVQRLGLEELPEVTFQKMEKVEAIYTLRHQYQHVYDQLHVATYMKDSLKKNLCATLMGYLTWIQKEAYPEENLKLIEIDHRDLAGSMQEEMEMLTRVMRRIELVVRAERIEEAEEAVAEIHDQARDPTYVQEPDSEEDEARDPSYVEESDIESDASEQIPLATALKTKKKTKQAEPAKEPHKRKRPAEDSAGSTDTPLKRARPDNTKRSHHRKRVCPVCGKEDGNLKRHLKSHAKKGHIESQQVDKIFSVSSHQESTRGEVRKTKKRELTGLPFKWCPVDGCEVVTHLLRSHLTHKHRLKPGPLLQNYLGMARSYKGKKEVDEVMRDIEQAKTSTRPPTHTVTSACITSPPPPTVHSTDSSMVEEDIGTEEKDDEEEQSYPEDERTIDYLTAANPKDKRQTWLRLFYNYLNTPDCGRKRDKNRLQHATHVRTILEDIDPKGKDIDILSQDEGHIVWTEWVDRKLECKRPGTVRSYLGSYRQFLQLVTKQRVRTDDVPSLSPVALAIFKDVKDVIPAWCRTIDLDTRPQKTEKILQTCDNRLTNDDVAKFHRSKAILQIQDLVEAAARGQQLSSIEKCEVRDYILAMLTLTTGTRPGALEKLTLDNYTNARVNPKSGRRVILVPNHKRSVDGPAMLPVEDSVQNLLHVWLKFIRPTFPDKGFPNLFLQVDGNAFDGWTIGRRLPELWKKSGVRPDLRVTATDIRQWLVTTVHERKAEGASFDEGDLRRTMCHSDKTAKRYYLRGELTEIADRGLDIILQCTPVPIPMPCVEDGDQADHQGGQAVSSGNEGDNPQRAGPTLDQGGEAEWAGTTSPQGGELEQCDLAEEDASQKRSLTRTEKIIISEVFADLIGSADKVQIQEVRHGMRKTVELRPLLEITGMDVKVADRVRHCQTISAADISEPPVDVPQMAVPDKQQLIREWSEAASTYTIASTLSSTKRAWEPEDSRRIEDFFCKMEKCPTKSELEKAFKDEKTLNEIMEREGMKRCIEKVKNLFKKWKKS